MSKQKKYHIYNGSKIVGTFFLSEVLKVELEDNLTMIDIPLEMYRGYCLGERCFEGAPVIKWIKNRVVPSGRQNISSILKQVGIEKYDELSIFLFANGKFTQDDFRIELISE